MASAAIGDGLDREDLLKIGCVTVAGRRALREAARRARARRIARASKVHFLRTLQTTFGTTPHRCQQRRRVERSMGPLRETDCRVTEIFLDVACTSLGAPGRVGR